MSGYGSLELMQRTKERCRLNSSRHSPKVPISRELKRVYGNGKGDHFDGVAEK